MRVSRIPLVALVTILASCVDSVAPEQPAADALASSAARATYPLVTITPRLDTVRVGASAELRTLLTNRRGRIRPGDGITWTSSDTSVLRVAASTVDGASVGTVTGRRAGRATVTARSESNTTAELTIVVVGTGQGTPTDPDTTDAPTPPGGPRVGFHVAPSGTARGDGSAGQPWDLATALAHPAAVQPGDTIWMHGGTYRGAFRSRLTGTSARHVVLRQLPGERATIDGSLFVEGASATYWGFEVMNSRTPRPDVIGVDIRAPNSRFVNLVVHDHGSNGIGFWSTAPDAEVYGAIVYNNGYQGTDRGHGHGIYAQNLSGTKRIADNVLFNQFGYGIHVYGSTSAGLTGFDIAGNVSFNNGSLSKTGNAPDLFVSGGVPAQRIAVTDNYTYQGGGKTTAVFGDSYGATNVDLALRDNYFIGTTKLAKWRQLAVSGNTFAGAETVMFLALASGQSASGYTWDRNTYVTKASAWAPFSFTTSRTQSLAFAGWQSATGMDRSSTHAIGTPSGVKVVVRPNRYEPGRATVVVYNWSGQGSATVDVSSILRAGSTYEVRNVQSYFASPVTTGTYRGGALTLPLAAVTPAAPVGGSASPPPRTGPQFHVFVVSTVAEGSAATVADAR